MLRRARNLSNNRQCRTLKSDFRRFHHADRYNSVEVTPIFDVRHDAIVEPGQLFHFWVESISSEPETEGAALLRIECLTKDGVLVAIPNWPNKSMYVGDYIYLNSGDVAQPQVTQGEFTVPEDVTLVRLTGHQWKAKIETLVIGGLVSFPSQDLPTSELASGTPLDIPYALYDITTAIDEGAKEANVQITTCKATGANLPISVSFYDTNGNELLPPTNMPQHKIHGPFVNCKSSVDSNVVTAFQLEIPVDAASVQFRHFDNWPSNGHLLGGPKFEFLVSTDLETVLNDLTDPMLSGPDCPLIFMDSTAPPLGHKTLSIRPNNLAREFAEAGAKVVYVPFSSLQGLESIVGENIVQFARNDFYEVVDYLTRTHWHGPKYYYCSSFPDWNSLAVLDRFKRNGWTIIYEVRDNMEEFQRVGYSKWYDPSLETLVAHKADCVITVSDALARKLDTIGNLAHPAVVIPNGVKGELIRCFSQFRELPQIASRDSEKRVGYVGHLTPAWFNWQFVIAAAEKLPDYTFEIVGHGAPDDLSVPQNLRILGPKDHAELMDIMPFWKVALIPFMDSPLTRGVDPNKIYEYLACANRVVSAEMGCVHAYPATTVYSTLDSFVSQIREQMETEWTTDELEAVEALLDDADWKSRTHQVLHLIAGVREATR